MLTFEQKRENVKTQLIACKKNFNKENILALIVSSNKALAFGNGLTYSEIVKIIDEVFGP